MSKLFIRADGTVEGVYNDQFRPIYEALGVLQVNRASEVEFEESSGDWVAHRVGTGVEIGRGKSRGDVIAQEIAYLEKELSEKEV